MRSFPLNWQTVALGVALCGVLAVLAYLHQLPDTLAVLGVGYIGGLLTPSAGKSSDQ